jgi:hypothetical protein
MNYFSSFLLSLRERMSRTRDRRGIKLKIISLIRPSGTFSLREKGVFFI